MGERLSVIKAPPGPFQDRERGGVAVMEETRPLRSVEIGIRSETDRLRTVAIWGEVGAEAALAQLYDPRVSLFSDGMDVLKARDEAKSFAKTLQSRGVTVYEVRDKFARSLDIEGAEVPDDIKQPFLDKADSITDETGIFKPGLQQTISELLDQDIERYGPERAYLLNKALSLDPEIPMGNLIYGRDTSNVVLGRRIRASMAYPIRQPETDVYERAYESMGMEPPITIPEAEKFEGGDLVMHDGVVYVGVGPRTTKGAALQIYSELKEDLTREGFRFAIVEDPHAQERPFNEQMDFMHLDMWAMPVAPGLIEVCRDEAERRTVSFLETGTEGKIVENDSGNNFWELMNSQNQDIIEISREEQKKFGCNLLNLDAKTVIIPDTILDSEHGDEILRRLEARGQEVILTPLHETTQGYGGAHCMTAQLLRR